MSSLVNEKAESILTEISLKKGIQFNPLLLIQIAFMILELFKVLKDCKKTEKETRDIFDKPNFLQKRKMKAIIKKARLDQDDKDIFEAIKTVGSSLSEEEIKQLYSEVQ